MENRILIVDDDESFLYLLAVKLTGEGYPCVTANNGRQALHHVERDRFSLIVSDIRMPEMNGIELLEKVKTLEPNMKVLLMTAHLTPDLTLEAKRLAAYDLVVKDLNQVVSCVRKALESREKETDDKQQWRAGKRT